jgi:hypothetical protein
MTVTGTDSIWNQPKEGYRDVATGTFIHHYHLAGYLAMCLTLGLGLVMANGEDNAATFRVILALPFVCTRIKALVRKRNSANTSGEAHNALQQRHPQSRCPMA